MRPEDPLPGLLCGPHCRAEVPPTQGGLGLHHHWALLLSHQCCHLGHPDHPPPRWNTEHGGPGASCTQHAKRVILCGKSNSRIRCDTLIPSSRDVTPVFRGVKESPPATTWLYGSNPNLPAWICHPPGVWGPQRGSQLKATASAWLNDFLPPPQT